MTSQRESPASDIPSDSGLGTLSIRDKSLLKRNINKHHNNNMSAGYVPVHETSLHKTGLRGKKTWAFWTLVGVLSALATANLILTVFILKVLRISHQAMEAVEIVSKTGQESVVKMHGNIDLGSIYKQDGLLESFSGDPLKITGDQAPVFVELRGGAKGGPRRVLVVRQNETRLQGVQSFSVYDAAQSAAAGQHSKPIFSTHYPNFGLPRGVRNIDVKLVETDRVRSPRDEGLKVRGEGGGGLAGGVSFATHAQRVRLLGLEGTRIDGGMEMQWSADQTVHLHSWNGSVVLKASGQQGGVRLDVKSMPIVGTGRRSGLPLVAHYKVCVCMPQGRLFRVPVFAGAISSSTACSYMKNWELTRKQARQYENIINQKLVVLSKLSLLVDNDESKPLTSREETFESAVDELKKIFSALDTINNKLEDDILQVMPGVMPHTLQRHREVFQDYSQEFRKIQQQFSDRREREDLLQNVRNVIDAYKTTTTGCNRRSELYSNEKNHLENSRNLVDNQLEIAMEIKENLNSQTRSLKQIGTRLNEMLSRFPLINGVLQRVNLRKRRDSLVMGLVMSLCALLMIAYVLH
ncbi:hypothetical protein LSTR_LSTR013725 [Laodelphax striatellus]|uniref:Beta-sarcoglycan n=1 Tax=Laodelphax striatellus TaxID=195883 RepID=A0A482XJW4_LAOST|nr:hypothetical protein LSTR_LSTR013725 [Laodelphax striatellus]